VRRGGRAGAGGLACAAAVPTGLAAVYGLPSAA
jgi:hypothetical protein